MQSSYINAPRIGENEEGFKPIHTVAEDAHDNQPRLDASAPRLDDGIPGSDSNMIPKSPRENKSALIEKNAESWHENL